MHEHANKVKLCSFNVGTFIAHKSVVAGIHSKDLKATHEFVKLKKLALENARLHIQSTLAAISDGDGKQAQLAAEHDKYKSEYETKKIEGEEKKQENACTMEVCDIFKIPLNEFDDVVLSFSDLEMR
jgi:hypothetical protein